MFAANGRFSHHRAWGLVGVSLATAMVGVGLAAAMARVFFVLVTGGGPGLRPGLGVPPPIAIAIVPSLILELFILAGIIHDRQTRGRSHPAWLIGAVVMTAVILLRAPLSGMPAWLAFADKMAHIAG